MKFDPFCRPNMKAVMKSMALEWLSSRTSTGSFLAAADPRMGKRREKMIVWEIFSISGEDCR